MAYSVTLNGKKVSSDSPEWKAYSERTKHRFAEMCEARQAPGAKTDREFFKGVGHDPLRDNEMDEEVYSAHKAKAASMGMSIENKKYFGSLADGPLDMKAWRDDFGGVQKLAAEQGGTLDRRTMEVTYEEQEVEEKPYAVADCVIERLADEQIAENPDLAHSDRTELEETIRADVTPEDIE